MAKKIVLTGGGTAGHVNPNIALYPTLKKLGYEVYYIGSEEGIEKTLISELDIPYFSISTGKLRRYLDKKNFSDAFRVVKGINDAYTVLKKIRPDIIFSKGGYVSVPVVLAAGRLKIPVIIHESDSTPGLANKISFKFSNKICASFPETIKLLPENKAVLTGSPIREELFLGNKQKGLEFCGFTGEKPIITVMGGSLGAVYVNNIVRQALDVLLENYDVVHMCGKDHLDESLRNKKGYKQFEYISHELGDIFAISDLIISRAGANAIFEILSLQIPNILIPLPSKNSRGDQIINAKSFADHGYSYVILQNELTKDSLLDAVSYVYENRKDFITNMASSHQTDAVSRIIDLIEENSSSVKDS